MCVWAKANEGNHLTEPTLCRTITHLRSPQSSHLLKSANVANYHECRASEEVCNMPRTRVLIAARAVMWCGVVPYDATPSRGDSRWKATCLPCTSVPLSHCDTLHSDGTTRRSLRAIGHSAGATSIKKTAFKITDGEAMTTWIKRRVVETRRRSFFSMRISCDDSSNIVRQNALCNKTSRSTSRETASPGRDGQIPSHTWQPRSIAKSTLTRSRSAEIAG